MKEKLTLRNVILWGVASVLVILFLVSFGATATMKGILGEGYGVITFKGALWGASKMFFDVDGNAGSLFIPVVARHGSIPGIIGMILLFLSAGGLVAVTFLIKDEKLKKILIFVCAGVILVASVLLFFVGNVVFEAYAKYWRYEEGIPITAEQIKAYFSGSNYSVFGIIAGILGILSAAGIVVSQLVIKDFKLIKSKEA